MTYRDHPEFVAFVRWWEDNDPTPTPTPLIDWLLERGRRRRPTPSARWIV